MSKPRKKKNNTWDNLTGFRYAHRGLFHQPLSASVKVLIPLETPLWKADIEQWKEEGKKIIPENSMAAFRIAVKHGFGAELDVHLTKDGRLAVYHDTNLIRVCGVNEEIENLTWDEISQLRLLDTDARIPEFSQVLDLYTSVKAQTERIDTRTDSGTGTDSEMGSDTVTDSDTGTAEDNDGNTAESAKQNYLHLPLIIELKAEKNVKELCAAVMETVDRYPALNYCIESFDPRVVYWFRKKRPDVIRGQLTENFCRSRDAVRKWGYIMTFGMWCGAPDILSRPDFIASKFRDRKNLIMRLRHRLGVKQVSWTIKNHRQLKDVDREGGLSIFERFNPGESRKNRKDRKNESDQEISE